jgi:hypothetical protein
VETGELMMLPSDMAIKTDQAGAQGLGFRVQGIGFRV